MARHKARVVIRSWQSPCDSYYVVKLGLSTFCESFPVSLDIVGVIRGIRVVSARAYHATMRDNQYRLSSGPPRGHTPIHVRLFSSINVCVFVPDSVMLYIAK